MSRSGGRSRAYREYHFDRRESMMVFTPEGEPTLGERRRTRSDLGDTRKSHRRWVNEDDSPRNHSLGWGKQPRGQWIRGGSSRRRGRQYRTRHSDYQGGADLRCTDLRWHLHQRKRSQADNWSPGRWDQEHSFECSTSPRRLSGRREASTPPRRLSGWREASTPPRRLCGRREELISPRKLGGRREASTSPRRLGGRREASSSPRRLSGRRGATTSLRGMIEASTSPRSGRREGSIVRHDDKGECSMYEDVDKHDDSYPEYQRYWDCVISEMDDRSEKRIDSKDELLSDISDDSLADPLSRASPKVKSLIMREEAHSRTPEPSTGGQSKPKSIDCSLTNNIHNRLGSEFDNSSQQNSSQKTGSNKNRAAHLEQKRPSDQIKTCNTVLKATTAPNECSRSDSDSSSSSSSSSDTSDTAECNSNCSCRATAKGGKRTQCSTSSNRRRMLPPEANLSSIKHSLNLSEANLSARSTSASRRGYREGGAGGADASFRTPTLEASILSSTLSSSDLSSSVTLSSSALSSSLYSSSDSGNASLLEVSPQRHDPRGFALEQLRRLTRWVLSSSVMRYMPSVRPPHLTGMQMGIQRDTDVNKWVECGVQHVVMVERNGPHVEAAKAAHHEAWLSGKCYSVDWVCRDYTREVWPHHPVDVACSHLALHTAFTSPSQAELFAHNVSCSLKEGSCLVATAFSAAKVLSLIRRDESGRSYESPHFKLRIHGGYSARSTLPQFGVKISLQIGPDRFEDSLVQLSVLEDVFQAHRLQLLTKRSFMQLFDETCSYSTCLRQLEELKLVSSDCPGRDKLSPALQEIADLFDVIIFRKKSSSSSR